MNKTFKNLDFKDIWEIFFPPKYAKWAYLGYAHIWGTGPQAKILEEFFKEVDKYARPKWCPKILLRALHLFGNDNSIVRVRNRKLHNLYRRITRGVMITDVKTKYNSWRIYGSFTDELWDLADATCIKLDEYETPYYRDCDL